MPQRRDFLKFAAGALTTTLLGSDSSIGESLGRREPSGSVLPPWKPGILEIHHIDTGRGNSTVILGPDGTSLLVDAGEAHGAEKLMAPARPDARRAAGEWIARYVRCQLDRIGQTALDSMLLTHLHGDHVGQVAPSSPPALRGNYRLTGASFVAERIEVHALIDRGWPDYAYPAVPEDPSARNYIAFARSMFSRGAKVERAQAGSLSQLALRRQPAAYPGFQARILSVNGEVWTGAGEASKPRFPALGGLAAEAMPSENMCCISVGMQYGKFCYYTGGDLCNDTAYGRYPWHDIETPVAAIAGPVSVAVANHHGYFDACGSAMVRSLRPRVWIVPTWHVSHPDISVLANLFSEELYSGERDVFAAGMAPAAMLTTERFSSRLASSEGHVVVRVEEGGDTFTVHVVGADDERGEVTASFGPFQA